MPQNGTIAPIWSSARRESIEKGDTHFIDPELVVIRYAEPSRSYADV